MTMGPSVTRKHALGAHKIPMPEKGGVGGANWFSSDADVYIGGAEAIQGSPSSQTVEPPNDAVRWTRKIVAPQVHTRRTEKFRRQIGSKSFLVRAGSTSSKLSRDEGKRYIESSSEEEPHINELLRKSRGVHKARTGG